MKRISKQVMAGNVKIGGGAPVTVPVSYTHLTLPTKLEV